MLDEGLARGKAKALLRHYEKQTKAYSPCMLATLVDKIAWDIAVKPGVSLAKKHLAALKDAETIVCGADDYPGRDSGKFVKRHDRIACFVMPVTVGAPPIVHARDDEPGIGAIVGTVTRKSRDRKWVQSSTLAVRKLPWLSEHAIKRWYQRSPASKADEAMPRQLLNSAIYVARAVGNAMPTVWGSVMFPVPHEFGGGVWLGVSRCIKYRSMPYYVDAPEIRTYLPSEWLTPEERKRMERVDNVSEDCPLTAGELYELTNTDRDLETDAALLRELDQAQKYRSIVWDDTPCYAPLEDDPYAREHLRMVEPYLDAPYDYNRYGPTRVHYDVPSLKFAS